MRQILCQESRGRIFIPLKCLASDKWTTFPIAPEAVSLMLPRGLFALCAVPESIGGKTKRRCTRQHCLNQILYSVLPRSSNLDSAPFGAQIIWEWSVSAVPVMPEHSGSCSSGSLRGCSFSCSASSGTKRGRPVAVSA